MKTINSNHGQSVCQPLSCLAKAKWKKIFLTRTFSRLRTDSSLKQQKKIEVDTEYQKQFS